MRRVRDRDSGRARHSALLLGIGWLAAGLGLATQGVAQAPDWMRARVLSGRLGAAMAYDTARERIVLFGGGVASSGPAGEGVYFDTTWEWDGRCWLARTPATRPPMRWVGTMAYDAARNQVVLFAGLSPAGFMNDTWTWDGTDWTRRSPTTVPPARYAHALAYDAARQVVVLFGGVSPTMSELSDTWTWDGTNWKNESPPNSPPARGAHALAYHATLQQVVLFGGFGGDVSGVGASSDTWEWNGTTWVQPPVTTSPPSRFDHALAYDTARRFVVLFGGETPSGRVADTWEWDGNNWFQRNPATSPPARSGHGLAYDAARQKVVVFGGFDATGTTLDDAWEWNGTSWRLLGNLTTRPFRRAHPGLAYDFARQRVVVFGARPGLGGMPSLDDTWLLGGLGRATTAAFGSGCPGATGTPILASNEPSLGNRALLLDILQAAPASLCLHGLSPVAPAIPIGPCKLYLPLPLPIVLGSLSNGAGFATMRLQVPLDLGLLGVQLHAQGFVLDPTAPPLGIAFTQGQLMRIGD